MIGKNYGERPEDGDQSYIHLQSLVASKRDKDTDFSRIIWLPKDVNTNQPQHQEFIKELWNSASASVEVLEKPLEEVKTIILDTLKRIVDSPNQTAETVSTPQPRTAKPSILVLYDKTDVESAAKVEEYINEKGFKVRSVADYLTGDPKELIEAQND